MVGTGGEWKSGVDELAYVVSYRLSGGERAGLDIVRAVHTICIYCPVCSGGKVNNKESITFPLEARRAEKSFQSRLCEGVERVELEVGLWPLLRGLIPAVVRTLII